MPSLVEIDPVDLEKMTLRQTLLKAQAIGMLIDLITMNRKVNKKPSSIPSSHIKGDRSTSLLFFTCKKVVEWICHVHMIACCLL